ncbi:uncharacterized protein LOC116613554 [Nematostella vectensis]|uniref:uncharacterized protein LOC116613554 n=1 Tax=Nematostella vectensis TaxID=45351 RepID=UPI00138FF70C|nr:uncharacterized protein LOC116613554 [Nematostella vectensis]
MVISEWDVISAFAFRRAKRRELLAASTRDNIKMIKKATRIIIFLGVLVMLQEIDSSHSSAISRVKKREIASDEEYECGDDDMIQEEENSQDIDENGGGSSPGGEERLGLAPQKPKTQQSSRRGVVRFLSKIFRRVPKTAQVLNILTSGASMFQAAFHAIGKCCHTSACDYRKDFVELKAEVEALMTETDAMSLRLQKQENWVCRSLTAFLQSMKTIEDIGNSQLEYLKTLSPTVRDLLIEAGDKAKRYIDRMKKTGENVEYMKVAQYYSSALDTAMNIGVPMIATLSPATGVLINYAKRKITAVEVSKLSRRNAIRWKNPTTQASSPQAQQLIKKNMNIGSIRTQLRQAKTLKTTLTQKVKRFAQLAGKGFQAAFDLASTGFNIYTMIKAEQYCKDIETAAKQSRDKLRETKAIFEEGRKNLTSVQAAITQAYGELYSNMTDDLTISNLEEIHKMLIDVSSKSDDHTDLVEIAGNLQVYVNGVHEVSGEEATFNLIQNNLLVPLKKVPFSMNCYKKKNNAMNAVLDGCKSGLDKTLDKLLEENFDTSNDEDNTCHEKIGEYINKDVVKQVWTGMAKNKNFNEVCILNSDPFIALICGQKSDGYNAKAIARGKAPVDAVQRIMDKCSAPKDIHPNDVETICGMKRIRVSLQDVKNLLKHKNFPESALREAYNNC